MLLLLFRWLYFHPHLRSLLWNRSQSGWTTQTELRGLRARGRVSVHIRHLLHDRYGPALDLLAKFQRSSGVNFFEPYLMKH